MFLCAEMCTLWLLKSRRLISIGASSISLSQFTLLGSVRQRACPALLGLKSMSYQEQLSPWVVHQLLPNLQRRTTARFRNRSEAEGYLRVISHMQPRHQFVVAFEGYLLEQNAKRASAKAAASSK